MPYKYLPVNLAMQDRRCLVVGGGNVALRKIETLLDYTADITVIAPEPIDRIGYYAAKDKLHLETRPYQSPEAADFALVISASDDKTVNRQVYDDCIRAGIPVNIVDNPKLCTITFPATVRRDCLSLAISTDGRAPYLSAHLRLILDELFPKHWNTIASLAAEYRRMVQKRYGDDASGRMAAFDRFLSADWKAIIKHKDRGRLRAELERLLAASDPDAPSPSA